MAAIASEQPFLAPRCASIRGLKALWPGVVEAAALIGSTQIQGRATIAGNICNGSPAADSVPALVAADAVATIVGAGGRRELAVAAIPSGPGKTVLDRSGDYRIDLPAGASAAIRRRLSALHTAHRDGHRGGRRRLSVSPWMKAGVCTAARVTLWAPPPRPCILVPEAREGPDRLYARHSEDGRGSPRRCPMRAGRSTTNAAHI